MASGARRPAARLRRDAGALRAERADASDEGPADAHRDDRHGLCRPRVRRLLRRVRPRGGLRRQGRRQDRACSRRAGSRSTSPASTRWSSGTRAAGRLSFTTDLAGRRSTVPRPCSSPSARRRAAATAMPTSPTCSPPPRRSRPHLEAPDPGRHQVHRAGRHRPQAAAASSRSQRPDLDDRRRLQPRVPARGLGDRGLPAPRPRRLRRRERARRARCSAALLPAA